MFSMLSRLLRRPTSRNVSSSPRVSDGAVAAAEPCKPPPKVIDVPPDELSTVNSVISRIADVKKQLARELLDNHMRVVRLDAKYAEVEAELDDAIAELKVRHLGENLEEYSLELGKAPGAGAKLVKVR